MATIITKGCVATCGYCKTVFEFLPSEARVSKRQVPAGYSPEEEAYTAHDFSVACPNCSRAVCATNLLGPSAKESMIKSLGSRHDDYE